jgi:hypothetical protein
LSDISAITSPSSELYATITSQLQTETQSGTATVTIQGYAKGVVERVRRLQVEAAQNPTGEGAQLLRRIVARGIDLEWFTKPWDEKTVKEHNDTLKAALLIGYIGLGIVISSLFVYDGVSKRLKNTPRNDPGRWGDLRRWLDGIKIGLVPSRDIEQGVELASMPIRPEPAHTAPARPSTVFEANPEP